MKKLVMASVALAMFSFLAFAGADAGRKERKARIMPAEVNLEAPYAVPQAAPKTSLMKAGAATAVGTVLDSTDYDYGFNSGWTQSVATYQNTVHVTYMHRDVDAGASPLNRRSQNYVYYNGTSWGTPVPMRPKSDGGSGFGGIDVFRGGAGAGFAAMTTHTPIFVAVDGGAGQGTFTPTPVAGRTGTDPEILVDNDDATLWLLDMGGRATMTVQKSTDFGQTWSIVGDTNLFKNEKFGVGGLDNPLLQGPNGDIIVATTVTGNGAVAPFGTSDPDSADGIGYWRWNGTAWSWTSWGDDGDYIVVGADTLYILFENFGQMCAVVDGSNNIHMVANGYLQKLINDTTSVTYFGTIYRKTGMTTWSLISRTADIAAAEYDTYLYPGNAIGFAYPGLAVEIATGKLFAVWSQPRLTSGHVDTVAGGYPILELWSNVSEDGGAAWGTATKMANTENGLFAYVARYLNPDAHLVYLEDADGGSYTGATSNAPMTYWRYVKIPGSSLVSVGGNHNVPTGFSLEQNYPNPFNPATEITYTLGSDEFVSLKVYNMLGQEVATLVNGMVNAGQHSVTFDASKLSTGLYLYKMTAGSFSEVKKMLLTK